MNVTTANKIHKDGGEMDDLFGVPVNKTVAGVHTPIEVYEGCKYYLCFWVVVIFTILYHQFGCLFSDFHFSFIKISLLYREKNLINIEV